METQARPNDRREITNDDKEGTTPLATAVRERNGCRYFSATEGQMNTACQTYPEGADLASLQVPAGYWILRDAAGLARVSGRELEKVVEVGQSVARDFGFSFDTTSLERAPSEHCTPSAIDSLAFE